MTRDVHGPWPVLYTDAGEFPLPPALEEQARNVGIDLISVDSHDRNEIVRRGRDCLGMVLYRARVDSGVLDAMSNLRILARCGTGYDLIDVGAARQRGIMVTYVPDFCTEELSDSVLLFVLAFARGLPHLMAAAREHRWLRISDMPVLHRLTGRTLGILGFGRSGQRAAEKARAFGIDVRVWSRTARPEIAARLGVSEVSFEDAMRCDYVSLHMPLTPQTVGAIGRDALRLMRPAGVLINIARGGIVDTEALVAALQERRIGGAALDVVDPAPLPPSHRLWDLPNVLITSHTACLSEEALYQSQSTALADTAAVLRGDQPQYPVPEMG